METKNIILELRNKAGLSQDELAEKVYVTRQAVSRWENGETTPKLPNGKSAKFLDDGVTYLGNQLECEFGGNRCFGIVANMEFILICTYEEKGANPELIVYRKR